MNYIDVEQMRKVLLDHLESQVLRIDGRTAMPFVADTMSDVRNWNWSMVAMGFVGKDIECADQLLREGDRNKTARGQKMRETGLDMISTIISAARCSAERHGLRSGIRDTVGPHLDLSLAAQCHRGHDGAYARISSRACGGAPSS